MPLSPEERHRIYLEEKERLEIRDELFVSKPTKKSSRAKWLFLIFAILFLAALTQTQNPSTYAPSESSAKAAPLVLPKLDFQWSKGGFDNVMMGNFTIHNSNGFDVKDIEITCQHFGKSGTQIDRNGKTIYEVVKAKSKKVVNGFNMGLIHSQAASTSCAVTHVERS